MVSFADLNIKNDKKTKSCYYDESILTASSIDLKFIENLSWVTYDNTNNVRIVLIALGYEPANKAPSITINANNLLFSVGEVITGSTLSSLIENLLKNEEMIDIDGHSKSLIITAL